MGREDRPILLVEDEADDVYRIRVALREAKVPNPVEVVEDVEEAIARLKGGPTATRASPETPALVILDLHLRAGSGLQLLGWLKEHPGLAAVPVVALVPRQTPEDGVRAHRLGAYACIIKPLDPGDFVAAVRTQVYSWASVTGPPHRRPRTGG